VNFERLKKMENKTVIDKPQTAKAEVKTKLKKSNFNLKPRLTAEKESSWNNETLHESDCTIDSAKQATSIAFHLNNKETTRRLAVNVLGNTLPYNPNLTYLGVKLDRQLTYMQHVEGLCQKIFRSTPPLRFHPRPAEPTTTAPEVEAPFPPPYCPANSLWIWDQKSMDELMERHCTSLPVLLVPKLRPFTKFQPSP